MFKNKHCLVTLFSKMYYVFQEQDCVKSYTNNYLHTCTSTMPGWNISRKNIQWRNNLLLSFTKYVRICFKSLSVQRSRSAPGLSGSMRAEYLAASTVSRAIGWELALARNSLNHLLLESSWFTYSTFLPWSGHKGQSLHDKTWTEIQSSKIFNIIFMHIKWEAHNTNCFHNLYITQKHNP